MNQPLQTTNNKTVTYQANGEEVKLSPEIVKQYLVRGNDNVTDQEVGLFLNLCKYQKLNPFLNEAYLVKYGKNAQIIVGKESFMKRAENHDQYEGFKAGIIIKTSEGIQEREGTFYIKGEEQLLGGWAEVYREDRSHPIKTTVSLSEYSTGQSTWNTMPSTMIRKTALVQALREAFPEELGAMYTEEEVQEPIAAEPVEEESKKTDQHLLDELKEMKKEEGNEEDQKESSEGQFEEVKTIEKEPKKSDLEDLKKEHDKYYLNEKEKAEIDWDKYTIDQIKQSLDRAGIPYDIHARKNELIELAEQHLNGGGVYEQSELV